jgi:hypothetical protein
MSVDPIAMLRKHYNAEQVRRVYERFDPSAGVPLCGYFAEARGDRSELFEHPQHGVQQMRKASYRDLPEVLRALGGEPGRGVRGRLDKHDEHFWPIATGDLTGPVIDKAGQDERLTMLAFMITWLEDT